MGPTPSPSTTLVSFWLVSCGICKFFGWQVVISQGGQSCGASRLSVCNQWGLPRLFCRLGWKGSLTDWLTHLVNHNSGNQKSPKRSPKGHWKVTKSFKNVIERSLKSHQKVTEKSLKCHRKVTKRSPKNHRKVTEGSPKGHRKVIKRSLKGHQKVTERLLKGHQKVNKRSTKGKKKGQQKVN